jgi:ectoine hydroxylase-related dioxygenase (phytanoyl-CoA dioxygenase family)
MDNKHRSDNTIDESSIDALAELLGLLSTDGITISSEDSACPSSIQELCHERTETVVEILLKQHELRETYENTSVCVFPEELSIPSAIMRRLADEVVLQSAPNASKPLLGVQRTYETISKEKGTELVTRRELTRLENLRSHDGWRMCDKYIGTIVSALLQRPQNLYKTKLNLKPSGGAGFAPHVDTPSLRLPFPEFLANDSFITIMIAIDDMTVKNGCLRVAKRPRSEGPLPVVLPRQDGNPDIDGRAGALIDGEQYSYEDMIVPGGTIVAFDGWVPHRSGVNKSVLGRRAVFFTYHDAAIGDFHDLYYERMQQLRRSFAEEQSRLRHQEAATKQATAQQADNESGVLDTVEYVALASVPK